MAKSYKLVMILYNKCKERKKEKKREEVMKKRITRIINYIYI